MEYLNKYGSYILFPLIAAVFIAGFYILSSIYASSSTKPKTVILENKLFNSNTSNKDTGDLQVESVTRLDASYPVISPGILDNNSLIFLTVDQSNKDFHNKIWVLDISNNAISEIGKTNGQLVVSSDGKKLLYSDFSTGESTAKTYLYDLQEKKILKTYDGYGTQILPDGSKYIGMLDDDLFIQNVITGEREHLIKTTEFARKIGDSDFLMQMNKLSSPMKIANYKLSKFVFSQDGNKVYFTGRSVGGTAIYGISLKEKNSLEVLAEGRISGFTPLSDGNLLLLGNLNEENGLFIYNTKSKNYKVLVQGVINNFDVTPDGKIAYILQNNNGVSELHVAQFDEDTIKSDKTVYTDLKYVSFLKWNRDKNMIFCVSDQLNKYQVFRFTVTRTK